jgi:peptidoglycan/xylan/chitin deacetylase (PgdA/CDA1 family)
MNPQGWHVLAHCRFKQKNLPNWPVSATFDDGWSTKNYENSNATKHENPA